MIINDKEIDLFHEPFLIAELSANHGGDINRAKLTIEAAANAGASAVKIQSYTPDTMTINSSKSDFVVNEGLWAGRTLYDLYSEAYTPFEWHSELFDHARNVGITLFSTPFDESAVDLLEGLNAPAFKIASFEIIDLPLIKYVAKKNKPMLVSTGMASEDEIIQAVDAIRQVTDADLLLFHCISSYPSQSSEANLSNLSWLKEKFDVAIGLSDHTLSNIAAITAVGMGAVAIEKHFKLDEKECGPDSSFSLLPQQFKSLVNDCNEAWLAKGEHGFRRSSSEKENLVFRRSLYFVNDLRVGQTIKPEDIRRIRPGYGMPPKYFDDVVGKKLRINVKRGEPVLESKIF